MSARRAMILAIASVCSLAANAASAPPSIGRLERYADPAFDGGIDAEGQQLAADLARDIAPFLPPAPPACGIPNPLAGRVVSVGLNTGPAAPAVPAALAPFRTLMSSGTPAQRAVALRAIEIVGRRATPFAEALRNMNPSARDAWVAAAASALTCDRYTDTGFDLVPPAMRPAPGPDPDCDGERAGWLLDRVADRTRRYPVDFFATAFEQVTEDCRDGRQVKLEFPEPRRRSLISRLRDPATDAALIGVALRMLQSAGPAVAPIAGDIEPLAHHPDPDVGFDADLVLVASATPAAVAAMRRLIVERDAFNWAWADYPPRLTAYAEALVPVFAHALHGPNFSNRVAAAKALGELGSAAAVPALEAAVSAYDWRTTEEVVTALAKLRDDPRARRALKEIARTYWSPKVRAEAKDALAPKPKPPDLDDWVVIGASDIDHGLPACRNADGHGVYRTADGRKVAIKWREPKREDVPQATIERISSWCSSVGRADLLPVEGGVLAGCLGFESDGDLVFLPEGQPLTGVTPVSSMATTLVFTLGGKLYAAGMAWFEVDDAGALLEVTRGPDGSWSTRVVAALASVPDAMAIVGDRVAFKDRYNVTLFDPERGVSALTCADPN